MCGFTVNPISAIAIPANSTHAIPNEMPKNLTFPKATPTAMTTLYTITV